MLTQRPRKRAVVQSRKETAKGHGLGQQKERTVEEGNARLQAIVGVRNADIR